MLFAKLNTPETYAPLVGHPVWDLALGALRELSTDTPLCITELRGEAMFINVHTYSTKLREECCFEGHRDYIDLQYVIRGGEFIEWNLKNELESFGSYDAERDFQFFKDPPEPSQTQVHLKAGYFVIFFPEDGHCPQIHDGKESEVLKAVVKIKSSLLEI